MKSSLRRTFVVLLSAVAMLAAGPAAAQQDYPSRPIRFIAISTPGTIADLVIRILSKKFNERLGWTTIVENRVSADWIVPAVHVVQSAPDGKKLS